MLASINYRSLSSFTCSPHEGGPMHLLLSRPWFGIATEPHKLRGQRVHRGLRPAVARLVGVVSFRCGRYQTSSTFVRWAGENRWAHILSEVVCNSTGLVAGPGARWT